LSEEYSTCLENISQTQKILKSKLEVLPDLEEALEEATSRFKEAEKARDLKYKADGLKKKLAWAHVATKEQVYIDIFLSKFEDYLALATGTS
jgi:structural maintenance of chromosomes protein 6